MSVFQIKLIAIIAMVIDHVGLVFFPELSIFRIIGRLSFPLFAWLIANGLYHTNNPTKYLLRLGIFAFISQIPYGLLHSAISTTDISLNIFFTLTVGLMSIMVIKKIPSKALWLGITFVTSLIAVVTKMEYGAVGIFSIVFFYLFFTNFKKLVFSQVLIYLSFYFIPIVITVIKNVSLTTEDIASSIQLCALAALVIIHMYNGKLGLKAQYLFYTFYPLHLSILWIIYTIVYT